MNELIDSDQERNAADFEETRAQERESSAEEDDEDGYDSEERSLQDSDEEREQVKKRKGKDAKINNSFTGPYPIDPTDFNHNDKGPNN